MEYIEQYHNYEWSDEWVVDYGTMLCYRSSGNRWGWEQQWRYTENFEMITPDSEDKEWIECLRNNHKDAMPSFLNIDLEKHGYKCMDNDLEHGWYNRVDDPKEIMDKLHNEGKESIIFKLNSVSQYATRFSVYAK